MQRQDYNPAPIRAFREARGLTQEAVATALGWHQTRLSRKERGEVPFDLAEIARLAPVYGTTAKQLAAAAFQPAAKGGR